MKLLIENARKHVLETKPLYNGLREPGRARIVVMGCGGGGCNTVDRLMKLKVEGAECIAINTDQQHLTQVTADDYILIGKHITRGLGAGGFPEIGAAAAEESRKELADVLRNADLAFVAAGLGGGTGTGAAPIVAEIAKETDAIVVGVVTTPFDVERARNEKAMEGLRNLRRYADTVVVIDNNKLLEIVPQLPIDEAFSVADEVLANMVKGITETISLPSLINLDYADVRTIMTKGGVAMVGIGESDKKNRVEEAVTAALCCPLLELDITGATAALIHISGGLDLTLEEATKAADIIAKRLADDATIIWGARQNPSLEGIVRVMLIVTGVQSPQVLGPDEQYFWHPDRSRDPEFKPPDDIPKV
ncbi:MAG: cell division protein FtsZ [Promethearchaeota archaeon]